MGGELTVFSSVVTVVLELSLLSGDLRDNVREVVDDVHRSSSGQRHRRGFAWTWSLHHAEESPGSLGSLVTSLSTE